MAVLTAVGGDECNRVSDRQKMESAIDLGRLVVFKLHAHTFSYSLLHRSIITEQVPRAQRPTGRAETDRSTDRQTYSPASTRADRRPETSRQSCSSDVQSTGGRQTGRPDAGRQTSRNALSSRCRPG